MQAAGRVLINKVTKEKIVRSYDEMDVVPHDSIWMEGEPLFQQHHILPRGCVPIPEKAWLFLWGHGTLNGYQFGEAPPVAQWQGRSQFWWRSAIRKEMEDYGIESPVLNKCVHTEHCCVDHGCKYFDIDCPVANGAKKQSFLCEDCDDGDNNDEIL